MRDGTAKYLSALHTALYRVSSGWIGRRLVDNDMLLLSTTGRVTGRTHTVPLLYLEDDRRYVVFASWGGRDRHPEWYLNLEVTPHAEVQIRSERTRVVAQAADDEEHAVWWARAVVAYDGYAAYQSKTERRIPVVFLDPSDRG